MSNPVAHQAHDLIVVGSNPISASLYSESVSFVFIDLDNKKFVGVDDRVAEGVGLENQKVII